MLELTKASTTTGLTRFTFEVPDNMADSMEMALKGLLGVIKADGSDVEIDDEALYPVEEVSPDNTPGLRLRGLRTREGLTQQRLADILGVKQHRISEMENNIRPVSVKMAKRLEEIFNVSYKAFI